MSIAQKIEPLLIQRQATAAAKAAEREARDEFIQAEFAVLTARFDDMLRTALGVHSKIALNVGQVVLDVHCRTFATLNAPTWTVISTIESAPKTVTFAPKMDFSQRDQFGAVVCTIDFGFRPGRSNDDRIAADLLATGVSLRGTQVGFLTLTTLDGPRDLAVSDLESAFGAWWLRP